MDTWNPKSIMTPTGMIFYDRAETLEWLVVGDYGKENNIKADFLGYTKRIDGVEHRYPDMREKMVVTLSSQKGCKCNCNFCDVPKVGFDGDVSEYEMFRMLKLAIKTNSVIKHTKRLNVHIARCGEPTFNMDAVLTFAEMASVYEDTGFCDTYHPVVSTMMPKLPKEVLLERLTAWCEFKNEYRDGNAGLQLSIQSTDDSQRDRMFNNLSHSLDTISRIAGELPWPKGRKYTLNFACDSGTVINAKNLRALFSPAKWVVKLTPIHRTAASDENGYMAQQVGIYDDIEESLKAEGFDVIVFIPSKEEDDSRITCGNALLSDEEVA